MSKYLYIDGEDYAAVAFEGDFKGKAIDLWNKAHEAGKTLEYSDEDAEVFFCYEALELDDETINHVKTNMDYDDSKHANYFKVEE